jgi:hypothetical protein
MFQENSGGGYRYRTEIGTQFTDVNLQEDWSLIVKDVDQNTKKDIVVTYTSIKSGQIQLCFLNQSINTKGFLTFRPVTNCNP